MVEDEAVFRFVGTPEGIELNFAFAQVVDNDKRLMFLGIVDDMGALHFRLRTAGAVQAENRVCT